MTRRGFLAGAGAFTGAMAYESGELDFPLVDYHVHLDEHMTLSKALETSKALGVKFGIVEHAGARRYRYKGMIVGDEALYRYLQRFKDAPVFKGIQAEGLDWKKYFAPNTVAKLDYVLSDALTFPDKDGREVRLWLPSATVDDKQDFMDRYTDFNVQVIATEPIDIIANPTFLPKCIASEYDALWTPARMKKIIDAAVRYNVAIEINSNYRLPSLAFLLAAKEAGAKFSFGSNIHGEGVGKLDYPIEMAKALKLTAKDMFTPAPPDKKPILIRR